MTKLAYKGIEMRFALRQTLFDNHRARTIDDGDPNLGVKAKTTILMTASRRVGQTLGPITGTKPSTRLGYSLNDEA